MFRYSGCLPKVTELGKADLVARLLLDEASLSPMAQLSDLDPVLGSIVGGLNSTYVSSGALSTYFLLEHEETLPQVNARLASLTIGAMLSGPPSRTAQLLEHCLGEVKQVDSELGHYLDKYAELVSKETTGTRLEVVLGGVLTYTALDLQKRANLASIALAGIRAFVNFRWKTFDALSKNF